MTQGRPLSPLPRRLLPNFMRRIFLILPLIALLAVVPGAGASSRQTVTFEAPRELLSASTRTETLDQITSFGVTNIRQLVYWRDFAPDPDSKTKPAFDASDPSAYPADKWDNLDGLIAAARIPTPSQPWLLRLLACCLGTLSGGGIVWLIRIAGTLGLNKEAMG